MNHPPKSGTPAMARLVPDEPLPPYSYVPGQFPHPQSDPQGHSHGKEAEPPAAAPTDWRDCRPYLLGLDLFNHGYYWEAHEVWESLWHAAGRKGTQADFFKALIKLAAAGVKAREKQAAGVRSHAARAGELLEKILPETGENYMGLYLPELIERAAQLTRDPVVSELPEGTAVEIVLPLVLCAERDKK